MTISANWLLVFLFADRCMPNKKFRLGIHMYLHIALYVFTGVYMIVLQRILL